MNKIIKHKKEIIISLLTGIFIFYIQPLLEYLGSIFIKTFLFISDKFSNSYYTSIAQDDATSFSEWNNFILNYFFAIIFIAGCVYLIDKRKKLQNNIEETLTSITEMRDQVEKFDTNEKKVEIEDKKRQILERVKDLEERANSLKMIANKRDNKIIFTTIVTVFAVILIFSNHAIKSSVTRQNLVFKNDLIKITPYTNDSVIRKLKSDWVRIENSKDFDKVKTSLDSLKSIYKLK